MDLEKLPPELVCSIGSFLPTKDTGALRLASRNVSSKVSGGPFASVIRSKTRFVDFSPHSLKLLVEMTQPGAPGTVLESLILVGVPWSRRNWKWTATSIADTPVKYEQEIEEDARTLMTALLAKALRNLHAHGAHRGLPSLSLTVDGSAVEELREEWQDIWMTASQMFHVTLDAMRHSEDLNIGALDLFTRPYFCSLTMTNFWRTDLDDLLLRQCAPTISKIRKLHLSISRELSTLQEEMTCFGMQPHYLHGYLLKWAPREAAIAQFLAAFRSVEDLKIHQYKTWRWMKNKSRWLLTQPQQTQTQTQTQQEEESPPENHHITQTRGGGGGALANLTRCSLVGLVVSGRDLLAFLQASPGLREVELRGIMLSEGRGATVVVLFRQILDWLTVRAGSQLRALRLEDLQEKEKSVVFCHEADDEVDDSDGWGRYRLNRRGEASVRRPVPFVWRGTKALELEVFQRAMDRYKLLYGTFPSNKIIEGTKAANDYC